MSIPVPRESLEAVMATYGSALLVTLPDAGVPHPGGERPRGTWPRVLTVDPQMDGDHVLITSLPPMFPAIMEAESRVTVAWPATQWHGYTLIVDGHATVSGDSVRITLDHAVLHRPATHADGPPPPSMD